MYYPRMTGGKLVDEGQMVGTKEHLSSKHRMVTVHGPIEWETNSCDTMLVLDAINSGPIKLVVTSPGGAVDAAFLMYDTIKTLRSPLYTLGRYCASAAVIYLAAGQKGQRYLLPHSKVMMHLVSGQVQGDAKAMEIHMNETKKYQNQMVEILRECGVKKTAKEILKDIDREFWLDAKEAISYGLADKIMDAATMREWLPSTSIPEKPFEATFEAKVTDLKPIIGFDPYAEMPAAKEKAPPKKVKKV